MTEDTSRALLERWRNGDERAAEALFRRYTEKLLRLVRRQMSAKLMGRLDPEDVVQSAFRSFFAGVREDRYVLAESGDTWRLLARIALHKLYHQVQRHTAAKRSVDREQVLQDSSSWLALQANAAAREPSPSEAALLLEELHEVLCGLKPLHRQMVELHLQGHEVAAIAAATRRSERMVRLVLEQIRTQLQQRCLASTDG